MRWIQSFLDLFNVVISNKLAGPRWSQRAVHRLTAGSQISATYCGSIQLLDLLAVGVLQEVVQVVLGRRLVRIPHVGVLV